MPSVSTSRALIVALCGAYFLVLLDVTLVNVALPHIGAEFITQGPGLAWTVDAYAVPLASLLLVSGAIGDRIGHRTMVLAGMVAFGAASTACALSPTLEMLIGARVFQGVGAALMLPGSLALLVEHEPREAARNALVGVWAAIGAVALPAGPVLGGLLVSMAGWRSIFWLSALPISLALIPVMRMPVARRETQGKTRLDGAGAVLLVTMLTCLVAAVLQSAAEPAVALCLVVAAVCAGGILFLVEVRASSPLIAVPRAARYPLAVASLIAGLMNACALGGLFALTQVLQGVAGLDPWTTGLTILPAMMPLPLLGGPAARLATRMGVWRVSALGAGIAALGMGGVGLTLPDVSGHYGALLLCLALWGSGLGVLTPAIVAAALQAVPSAPGMASGVSNTARQAGGAVGVALVAAVSGPVAAQAFAGRAGNAFAGGAIVLVCAGVLCWGTGRHSVLKPGAAEC